MVPYRNRVSALDEFPQESQVEQASFVALRRPISSPGERNMRNSKTVTVTLSLPATVTGEARWKSSKHLDDQRWL